MSHGPVPRGIVFFLLAGALVLPTAVCVLLVLSTLLGAMGDGAGAQVLRYTSWAIGAAWFLAIVCLVIVLAVESLCQAESSPLPRNEDRDFGPDEGA